MKQSHPGFASLFCFKASFFGRGLSSRTAATAGAGMQPAQCAVACLCQDGYRSIKISPQEEC